jgi:putative transposase
MLDFSRPGKPTDNAFIESLNGKFPAEFLNTHWFMSLDEAARKCEAWRRDYNEVRSHSGIGNEVPAALHRTATLASLPSDEAGFFRRRVVPRLGASSKHPRILLDAG